MNIMNTLFLGVALLVATPTFSTPADNNDDGSKQTLTVNEEKIDRTVSEIRLDGNNAVLLFTDGTTLTADMRLVSLTMSYDETTEISSLNVTDKKGNVKVYDLQGRPVSNSQQSTTKGIYIVRSADGRLQGKNGKKVVRRARR